MAFREFFEGRGEAPDGLIARLMPEMVVDGLKVVHVEDEDPE